MNDALARWNGLQFFEAAEEILPCCGSKAWARGVAARRPIHDEAALLSTCDEVWKELPESDWMEAFRSHPRIGESHAPVTALPQSVSWSKTEQHGVSTADDEIKRALAEGNRAYEQRFKRVFIVCASGKSASEILEILGWRLRNDDKTELQEAAEQQRQIAHIRLRKWISS
jgi:2-oxo-4-hydroxy-4-carboxy-5-ureidoimidazoline decarboxylase